MDNDYQQKTASSDAKNDPIGDVDRNQPYFSPWRFLFITIGGIFLAEIVAMIVLINFDTLPYYLQTLIDASIMVILIFPVVYYFSLRPLLIHIEKRNQTEAALRKSEERFVKAFHFSPVALSITRVVDGGFIDVNESFLHIYGSRREDVIGHTSIELGMYVKPEERDEIKQQMFQRQLLAQEGIRDYEIVARTRSGETRAILLSTEGIELGGEQCILASISDITERKHFETHLRQVNRALSVLNECNQVLVRAENEVELLQKMCSIIVNVGEYRMAWVGFAEPDQVRSVRVAAQFGFEEGYLDLAQITWADNERGHGPTGTAIREGTIQVNQNFLTNPKIEPWRTSALARGYQASIALPLVNEGSTFGALTIYSASPNAFDEEEVNLLTELANDLAFGITALHVRAECNRAQEQIREMALFSTLNPDAVLRVDASGQIKMSNPAANQMGLCDGAILTEIIPDLHELDLPACIMAGTMEQNQIEARLGEKVLLWTVRGVAERGLAFLYGKDITERKHAEAVVRQLSSIVEQTEDTVVVTDWNGVIEYVNPAFEHLTGYTREEAVGKTPKLLKSGQHDDQFYQELWKTILNGGIFLAEIANRKKNGELFYEVQTITPLRDTQGTITHFVATGKDITEHKRDEEKLRQAYDELELRVQQRTEELSNANSNLEKEINEREKVDEQLTLTMLRLEAHIDNSPLAVIEFDPKFRVIRWSHEAERVFGWSANEVVGRGISELNWVYEADAEIVAQVSSDMLRGKLPRNLSTNRNYRKDGTVIYCEWYNSALYDVHGCLTSILSLVLDVTERKYHEDELLRFNHSMVGRELRMIELKKEVNELCRQASQLPRYSLDFEKEAQ